MKRSIGILAILLFAGAVRAEEMAYVIKVTPALVYLDAGAQIGLQVGDRYMVLREKDKGYAQVGEVRVVRVYPEFSIAEISYVAEGEVMEVLQRAIPMGEWEEMAEPTEPRDDLQTRPGRRTIYLIGGGEWARKNELSFVPGTSVLKAKNGNGGGVGVRLSSDVGEKLRLNLTYRMGFGGDVKPMGIEGDVHFVFRGNEQSGLYVGAGVGFQHLSYEPAGAQNSSANKFGLNLLGGLQFPGRWNFLVEGGYQKVVRWDDLIDLSNVRTFVGVGRSF